MTSRKLDIGNGKRKHCGELDLEEAMDLSFDRVLHVDIYYVAMALVFLT